MLFSSRTPWISPTTTTIQWRWPTSQLRCNLPRQWLVNLALVTPLPSVLWIWNRYGLVSVHQLTIPLSMQLSLYVVVSVSFFSDWLYGPHHSCRWNELHVVSTVFIKPKYGPLAMFTYSFIQLYTAVKSLIKIVRNEDLN